MGTGLPCRPRPRVDRAIATLARFFGEDVADAHGAPLRGQIERRPRRALICQDLVDALHLPARQPVLHMEVQADQRLCDADRRLSSASDVWTAYASTEC
jgi:hypothetical protein